MEERFEKLGIPVTMTRDSDETVDPTERVKRILDAYGDEAGVIIISNHINAGGGDGAEVIYALRNNNKLSDLILKEIENSGQNIREAYQRRLPSDTAKDYYFIHRDTGKNTQPVIVEYGFLDSTGDDVNQLKSNSKLYAEAVVKAVMEYIGKSYVPPILPGETTYIVKAGDNLYSIANKFNTSVAALKKVNNLTTNDLKIGQILKIPTSEVIPPPSDNNIVYKVVAGDSLYSIASKYNTTVDAIKRLNNLSSNNLSIGQTLLIPNTTAPNPTPPTDDENIYIVKSGDSLYSIASRFGVTVDDLIKYNNLNSTLLNIGQILKIPTDTEIVPPTTNDIIYTVKSGDSLWNIANKYNTTVDTLMKYNNLTSNLLSIGQTLKIPVSDNQNTYTVKTGDSLWSIANKFNTTVDEIKRKNNLTSNLLSIGQVLKI